MTQDSRTKLVLSLGVVFTIAVAGTATVYVPEFSDAGKQRRTAYQTTGRVLKGEGGTKRPGSMFENMNKKVKEER